MALIPFPTRLLAEYLGESDAARVAATVYGLTLLAVSVLVAVLWRYAVGTGLVRPDAEDQEIETLTTKLTPGLAGYVVMILLGLFLPTVAVMGHLAIAIALIVPFGLRRGHRLPGSGSPPNAPGR